MTEHQLEEQKEFLQEYQQIVGEDKPFSAEELEEMESVLYSVSFGKQEYKRKACY